MDPYQERSQLVTTGNLQTESRPGPSQRGLICNSMQVSRQAMVAVRCVRTRYSTAPPLQGRAFSTGGEVVMR